MYLWIFFFFNDPNKILIDLNFIMKKNPIGSLTYMITVMCDQHISGKDWWLDTGRLQRPTGSYRAWSLMLSAKADELMRFSAPTPQLASMKALKAEHLLLFHHTS